MTVKKILSALRDEMKKRNLAAYIIPSDDYHGSEYVGSFFKARAYVSGFTGSAGTLVVLKNEAALWTDGRYFLQASRQLEGSSIELMKSGEPGVPTLEGYLRDKLEEKALVGFDARTITAAFGSRLTDALSDKSVNFYGDEDLVGLIWSNRPPLSAEPVWAPKADYMGGSRQEKLELVRKAMEEKKADILLLTALDEIAWLTNLRGNDVAYTPVFLSFMLITAEKAELYAMEAAFSSDIRCSLQEDGFTLRPYNSFTAAVQTAGQGKRVWADKAKTNYSILKALADASSLLEQASPVELLKAIKNKEEQEGLLQAHIRDGAAFTHFMFWIKQQAGKEAISELSAADTLLAFRRQQPGFMDESFAPIIGYGPHGAIIHYSATEESSCSILPEGLLLCDTGGQYDCGTTDITRTLVLGPITDEARKCFTLVLKGHLNLGAARFKKGCYGASLDFAARQPLWEAGMDYNHGTGHGVGFMLSVHEGPQRIHYAACQGNPAKLEPGMVLSNEPGLYLEGKFGIRHENLVLVVEDIQNEYGSFLRFKPLTMVPFDKDGLDLNLLSPEDKTRLNEYHKAVYRAISFDFEGEELAWLQQATAPIE